MYSAGKRLMLMPVALLAEGVDRNVPRHTEIRHRRVVALLAEGVDRNDGQQLLRLLE